MTIVTKLTLFSKFRQTARKIKLPVQTNKQQQKTKPQENNMIFINQLYALNGRMCTLCLHHQSIQHVSVYETSLIRKGELLKTVSDVCSIYIFLSMYFQYNLILN